MSHHKLPRHQAISTYVASLTCHLHIYIHIYMRIASGQSPIKPCVWLATWQPLPRFITPSLAPDTADSYHLYMSPHFLLHFRVYTVSSPIISINVPDRAGCIVVENSSAIKGELEAQGFEYLPGRVDGVIPTSSWMLPGCDAQDATADLVFTCGRALLAHHFSSQPLVCSSLFFQNMYFRPRF